MENHRYDDVFQQQSRQPGAHQLSNGPLEARVRDSAAPIWVGQAREWLDTRTPQDLGYFRSRWTCELIANMFAWDGENPARVSTETFRRWLKRDGYAWNRPRSILGLRDEEHDRKVRHIHRLLRNLPADEAAVFQDEVDINLKPKSVPHGATKRSRSQCQCPATT